VLASAAPVAEAFNEFGKRVVAELQARRRAEDAAHVRPAPATPAWLGPAGSEAPTSALSSLDRGRPWAVASAGS